jgi:hypothetical protein
MFTKAAIARVNQPRRAFQTSMQWPRNAGRTGANVLSTEESAIPIDVRAARYVIKRRKRITSTVRIWPF